MKLKFFRRKEKLDELADFESFVDATLVPMFPRPEFVSDLGQQLWVRALKVMPPDPGERSRKWILMVGGIIGSTLMIITSIRGLMALVSVLKLLIQRNNRDALPRRSASAA